jgi:energy-coupling factor transporter ATP-binding protein EcfA2
MGLSLIFFNIKDKIKLMITGTHPAWQQALISLGDGFYEQDDALVLGLLVWLSGVPLIIGGHAGSGKSTLLNALKSFNPQHKRAFPSFTATTTQANEKGVMVWLQSVVLSTSYAKFWSTPFGTIPQVAVSIEWHWIEQQAQVVLTEQVINLLQQVRLALEQGGLRLSLKRWHFVVQVLKTAALIEQRFEVTSEDLWLLPYIIDNHPHYREPIYQRVASILSPTKVSAQEQQLEGWMKQVADIQRDMNQTLADNPHTLERLKEFLLELRGKEEPTYRLLYEGEESHLKVDDYQQLVGASGYRMVSLYQPSAVLGVSPRVERVEMKLTDDFILVNKEGQSYFLLTQTITLPAYFSLLQRSYFEQQLDAVTLQLFEAREQESVSVPLGLAAVLSPITGESHSGQLYEEILSCIKSCREKLYDS